MMPVYMINRDFSEQHYFFLKKNGLSATYLDQEKLNT